MDVCPTEVLAHIFHLACSDDPHAYPALSTVSKYVHQLVRPFQYHTLAISGPDHAHHVSAHLASIDAPHLRRIHHLFISDHDPSPRTTTTTTTQKPPPILHILTLAAPTLHTLAFHASHARTSPALISLLFRLSFPRLSALSLTGFYPFPRIPDSLPRLTHLHLRGNRNPHGILHTHALRLAAPSLTHLRISGLSMAVSFAEELALALRAGHNTVDDDPSPQAVETRFPPELPPNLRTLVIQPAAPLELDSDNSQLNVSQASEAKDQLMMERLSALACPPTGANSVVHVVLCDRESQRPSPDYDYEQARREWARRLNKNDHSDE